MAGGMSGGARDRQPSWKKRVNDENATASKKKQKKKRRKQSSRRKPSSSPDSSDSDDSNDSLANDSYDLTPPPILPDFRNFKFTVQFTVYLDKDRVGGFGRLFALEEVSFEKMIEQAQLWVHHALTDTDIEIHWLSSIASMKAYRCQPVTNDVRKAEQWDVVEDLIKEAYAEGKTGFRVDWDLKYKKGGPKGTHATSQTPAASGAAASQGSEMPDTTTSSQAPASSQTPAGSGRRVSIPLPIFLIVEYNRPTYSASTRTR